MMDIDKLEAGRELDALVAEKVMGWTWCAGPRPFDGMIMRWLFAPGKEKLSLAKGNEPMGSLSMPHYSTDVAAAWEVVERLVDDGHCPGLIFDDNGHWALPLEGTQNCPMGPGPQDIATSFFIEADMWAETAPLAICRAALRLYNGR